MGEAGAEHPSLRDNTAAVQSPAWHVAEQSTATKNHLHMSLSCNHMECLHLLCSGLQLGVYFISETTLECINQKLPSTPYSRGLKPMLQMSVFILKRWWSRSALFHLDHIFMPVLISAWIWASGSVILKSWKEWCRMFQFLLGNFDEVKTSPNLNGINRSKSADMLVKSTRHTQVYEENEENQCNKLWKFHMQIVN